MWPTALPGKPWNRPELAHKGTSLVMMLIAITPAMINTTDIGQLSRSKCPIYVLVCMELYTVYVSAILYMFTFDMFDIYIAADFFCYQEIDLIVVLQSN